INGLQSSANNINGDPVEELDLVSNGFTGTVFLRVGLLSGPAPSDIRLLAVGNSTGKVVFGTEASNTNSGTLFGHNGTPGGSVGATDVHNTAAFGGTRY